MKLSEHFTLKEMTKSPTAARKGISNIPNDSQVDNLRVLCEMILEPLRGIYGEPIRITSGFRSAELNKALRGAKNSHHMSGFAADIDNDDDNAEIFYFIKDNMYYDQLIAEFPIDKNPTWIHVSYINEEKNRNQVLVAYKNTNKKTKYKKFDGNL